MNERTYCVYMHKNKETGKVYIGCTCNKVYKRWSKGNGYKGNKKFYEDIQKYGWDNFEHIILFNGLNNEQAKELEMYYIQKYKDNSYNRTKGGEQGKVKYNTDEDIKQSFRDNSKKYYDTHEDYRKKVVKNIMNKRKNNYDEYKAYQKDYYNSNEKYHQYKIEYQRKYREQHRKTNRPFRKNKIIDNSLNV